MEKLNEIKNLIASGKTLSAIDFLLDYYTQRDTELYNKLLLLKSQYNDIKAREISGRPYNRADLIEIQNSILELLDFADGRNNDKLLLTVHNLRRQNIYVEREILDNSLESAVKGENPITFVHGQSGSGKTFLIEHILHKQLTISTYRYIVFVKCYENLDLNTVLDTIIYILKQPSLRQLSLDEKQTTVNSILATSKTIIAIDSFEKIRTNDAIKNYIFNLPHPTQLLISSTINEMLDCKYIQVNRLSENEFKMFVKELTKNYSSTFVIPQKFNWSNFYKISGGLPHLISKIVSISRAKGYNIETLLNHIKNHTINIPFEERVLGYIWDKELSNEQKVVINYLSIFQSTFSIATISGITEYSIEKCEALVHSLHEINFIDLFESNKINLHDIVYYFVNSINGEYKKLRNMQKQNNLQYCASLLKENGGHANWDKFPNIQNEWDYIWNTCQEAYKSKEYEYVIMFWENVENFLFYYGYYETRFILSGWAKEAAEYIKNTKILPWILVAYGETDMYLHGDKEKALSNLYDALDLFTANKDKKGMGYCKYDISRLLRQMKKLNEAKDFLLSALEISKQINDSRLEAYCLNNLGKLELAYGNNVKAEEYLRLSMPIWSEIKDYAMVAICKRNLLQVNRELGNYKEAEKLYKEAIDIFEQLNTNMEIGEIKYEMARLYVKTKEFKKAEELLNEAEIIFNEAHSQAFLDLVNELKLQIK